MSGTNGPVIVVVGGVAGGASAAARARRMNEHATIILYEKDEYISFANCGMPYHIGGEIDAREKLIVAQPELLINRFNIDVKTFHQVKSLDLDTKMVSVENRQAGETFDQSFDKLILAPGANPIVPPIPGVDSDNVFTLRNLADMDRIIAFMKQKSGARVAVIGAGFIGIEMAEQLRRIGADTVLVELQDQVLPPLDREMAKPIQMALAKEGVAVKVGSGIQGLQTETGQVTRVKLDNGEEIEVDAVILGIGVRPNTGLAEAAGLSIGKTGGIAVNEFMQTSHPDVYAVGDAVEYRHAVLGIDMRVALAGPANRAGRTAGEHAATGKAHPAKPVLGTAVLRAFGCSAAMTGLSSKQAAANGLDARSVTIIANNHAGYFPGAAPIRLKLVYEAGSGRVLGAQAVGADGVDKRIDVIATAIGLGGTVQDLTGLDLCYAPPFGSAKDPVHMAAFTALNDLDGITPILPSDADVGDAQVVDVRTDKEVKMLPMEGAIHIPVDVLRANLDQLDPSKPTIVVCQSGLRAHTATRILKQSGFTEVHNLTGGMAVRSMTK